MSDDTPTQDGAAPPTRPPLARDASPADRRGRLLARAREAHSCTRCPQLVASRTQVVYGEGDPAADVMFVGEAPGAREDEQGISLVGAAGALLDELLALVGLGRSDVFVTNVLKCSPPGNRDPAPAEIARCRPYLHEQIALVQPRVVCTLGNFSTRLLRDDPTGIKALHGRAELRTVGDRTVYLLPLYHPAAALYTRALRDTLERDVAALTELLARPAPAQPQPEPAPTEDPGPEAEPPMTAQSAEDAAEAGSSEITATDDDAAPTTPAPAESTTTTAPRRPAPADDQLGLF